MTFVEKLLNPFEIMTIKVMCPHATKSHKAIMLL